MADLQEVSTANWEAEVAQSPIPVIVDFWAPWCGPCRMMQPTVEALAVDLAGRIRVVKCNLDENREVAMRFGVSSIPILILFKEGRVVDQVLGAGHPKARLLQKFEAHLS